MLEVHSNYLEDDLVANNLTKNTEFIRETNNLC